MNEGSLSEFIGGDYRAILLQMCNIFQDKERTLKAIQRLSGLLPSFQSISPGFQQARRHLPKAG